MSKERPSWDAWFMRIAFVTAQRASCPRKKVGAIVVRDRDRRVISGGYNGAPRGMPDCLEVGCEMREIDGKGSCVRTLHAESNALDLCGPLNEPHTLYCTVIPCRNCALRIIQHGITRVVYHEYYESQGTRDVEALFACKDPSTIKMLADKHGDPNETGWLTSPRVKLDQITTATYELAATYVDVDELRRLAWVAYRMEHALHARGSATRTELAQALSAMCHLLDVEPG